MEIKWASANIGKTLGETAGEQLRAATHILLRRNGAYSLTYAGSYTWNNKNYFNDNFAIS